jgi:hypothetical protein
MEIPCYFPSTFFCTGPLLPAPCIHLVNPVLLFSTYILLDNRCRNVDKLCVFRRICPRLLPFFKYFLDFWILRVLDQGLDAFLQPVKNR